MTVLCICPERRLTELMRRAVVAYHESATFLTAETAEEALYETDTREIDAVLTVPSAKDYDGVATARKIYEISPRTVVILVSEDTEAAYPALRARARGYLVKPDAAAICAELADLGIGGKARTARVEARTFGNFELLADGKPVRFGRSKSKELIAYLIYRRGTGVSASELIVNLWEDKDVDRTTRSMLHNLLADVRHSLAEAGAERVFSYERNCYRVLTENLSCDYFDYLEGKENADDLFIGEFLSDYEWAEYACGELETIRQKRAGLY